MASFQALCSHKLLISLKKRDLEMIILGFNLIIQNDSRDEYDITKKYDIAYAKLWIAKYERALRVLHK